MMSGVVPCSGMNLGSALPQMTIVCAYGGAGGRGPVVCCGETPALFLASWYGEP